MWATSEAAGSRLPSRSPSVLAPSLPASRANSRQPSPVPARAGKQSRSVTPDRGNVSVAVPTVEALAALDRSSGVVGRRQHRQVAAGEGLGVAAAGGAAAGNVTTSGEPAGSEPGGEAEAGEADAGSASEDSDSGMPEEAREALQKHHRKQRRSAHKKDQKLLRKQRHTMHKGGTLSPLPPMAPPAGTDPRLAVGAAPVSTAGTDRGPQAPTGEAGGGGSAGSTGGGKDSAAAAAPDESSGEEEEGPLLSQRRRQSADGASSSRPPKKKAARSTADSDVAMEDAEGKGGESGGRQKRKIPQMDGAADDDDALGQTYTATSSAWFRTIPQIDGAGEDGEDGTTPPIPLPAAPTGAGTGGGAPSDSAPPLPLPSDEATGQAAAAAASAPAAASTGVSAYDELDGFREAAEYDAAIRRARDRPAELPAASRKFGGGLETTRRAAANQLAEKEIAEIEVVSEAFALKRIGRREGADVQTTPVSEIEPEEEPTDDDGDDKGGVSSSAPPILVLCQTNHALDQFLEGILSFEPRVIRIGGRSQSEVLKKHNLTELLEARKRNRPAVERSARRNLNDMLRRTRDRLSTALVQLQQAFAPTPLPSSQLRGLSELRGPLGAELRRLPDAGLQQWLCIEGAAESHHSAHNFSMHDERHPRFLPAAERAAADLRVVLAQPPMTPPELLQHCNRAEVYYTSRGQQEYASEMAPTDRWRLHNALKELAKESALRDLEAGLAQYRRVSTTVAELDEVESLDELTRASVVGLTTTGAAKHQALVRQLGCRVLVMEEAAEVLEAHVLASINASTQQLLLIGDHQQLRPGVACHELTLTYSLDVSLFERALNNHVPFVRLRTQRRMRPSISRLILPIYPDLIDHQTTMKRPRICGFTTSVHFITHEAPERCKDDLMSPENPHEVAIILHLAALCQGMGYAQSRITVLSAYVGQLLLLRAAFTACGLDKVLVTTVDSYQGEENDIVLLSLVRSNADGKLGFTSVDNRVCVALSRARLGFFCACNLRMLSNGSELWQKLSAYAAKEHRASAEIPLATPAALNAARAEKARRLARKASRALASAGSPLPPQPPLHAPQLPPAAAPRAGAPPGPPPLRSGPPPPPFQPLDIEMPPMSSGWQPPAGSPRPSPRCGSEKRGALAMAFSSGAAAAQSGPGVSTTFPGGALGRGGLEAAAQASLMEAQAAQAAMVAQAAQAARAVRAAQAQAESRAEAMAHEAVEDGADEDEAGGDPTSQSPSQPGADALFDDVPYTPSIPDEDALETEDALMPPATEGDDGDEQPAASGVPLGQFDGANDEGGHGVDSDSDASVMDALSNESRSPVSWRGEFSALGGRCPYDAPQGEAASKPPQPHRAGEVKRQRVSRTGPRVVVEPMPTSPDDSDEALPYTPSVHSGSTSPALNMAAAAEEARVEDAEVDEARVHEASGEEAEEEAPLVYTPSTSGSASPAAARCPAPLEAVEEAAEASKTEATALGDDEEPPLAYTPSVHDNDEDALLYTPSNSGRVSPVEAGAAAEEAVETAQGVEEVTAAAEAEAEAGAEAVEEAEAEAEAEAVAEAEAEAEAEAAEEAEPPLTYTPSVDGDEADQAAEEEAAGAEDAEGEDREDPPLAYTPSVDGEEADGGGQGGGDEDLPYTPSDAGDDPVGVSAGDDGWSEPPLNTHLLLPSGDPPASLPPSPPAAELGEVGTASATGDAPAAPNLPPEVFAAATAAAAAAAAALTAEITTGGGSGAIGSGEGDSGGRGGVGSTSDTSRAPATIDRIPSIGRVQSIDRVQSIGRTASIDASGALPAEEEGSSADEDYGGEHAQMDVCHSVYSPPWYQIWQGNVHSMRCIADGQRVLPTCGLRMPCGHSCTRAKHIAGGTIECYCVRCGNPGDLAETERQRWRALREALKLKGDGTIPLARAESLASAAADEPEAAQADTMPAMPPPPKPPVHRVHVSNFTGAVGPNLNMVGYMSAPPKVRVSSLREHRGLYATDAPRLVAEATADAAAKYAASRRRQQEEEEEASRQQQEPPPQHSSSSKAAAHEDGGHSRKRSHPGPRASGHDASRSVSPIGEAGPVDGGSSSMISEAEAMAAGWRKCYSKSHKRDFWFHSEGKRREWSLDKIKLPQKGGSGGSRGGTGSGATQTGGSSSSRVGGGNAKRTKSEWEKKFSVRAQRAYYMNVVTKERVWRKPEGFVDDDS